MGACPPLPPFFCGVDSCIFLTILIVSPQFFEKASGVNFMKTKPFRILFLFLLAGRVLTAAETPKFMPALPADIRVERGIAYLPADRKEKADLYFPLETSKAAQLPAVVIIHGGGWEIGQRGSSREINIGSTLARNGYVAMSIDYLLSISNCVVWPTNLWDCKTAVRWLRKNANHLGIDPNRIGVIGGSAGGQLASMVALTTPSDGLDPSGPYENYSCAVCCCVDMYGVVDLAAWRKHLGMLGKSAEQAPELYRQATPLTYVRSNSPPFLILHGTADKVVNIEQSRRFAEAMQNAGVEHEFVIVPNAPHTFDLQPKQQDLRPIVLGFLDKYLKPQTGK